MWEPREADEDRFTNGDCHIFAFAVHRLTGWPLAGLLSDEQFPGEPSFHAFCIAPDGRAVDVMGLRPLEDILSEWGGDDTIIVGSRDKWPKDWRVPVFGDYSRVRARRLAGKLVTYIKKTEGPALLSERAGPC